MILTNSDSIAGDMYLKTILIHGFKTFAESTQIEMCRDFNIILSSDFSLTYDLLYAIDWAFRNDSEEQEVSEVISCGSDGKPLVDFAEIELCFGIAGSDAQDYVCKKRISVDHESSEGKGKVTYSIDDKVVSRYEYASVKKLIPLVFAGIVMENVNMNAEDIKQQCANRQTVIATTDKSIISELKPAHLIGRVKKDGITEVHLLSNAE